MVEEAGEDSFVADATGNCRCGSMRRGLEDVTDDSLFLALIPLVRFSGIVLKFALDNRLFLGVQPECVEIYLQQVPPALFHL